MEKIAELLHDSELFINWLTHNNETIRRSISDVEKDNFECYDDRNYDVFIKNEYDHVIGILKTNVETLQKLLEREQRPTIDIVERFNKLKTFVDNGAVSK